MSYLRRLSDKRRSSPGRRSHDTPLEKDVRSMPWDDQRTQFLTRFLFWAMYLAYFNLGDMADHLWPNLMTVNLVAVLYPLLTLGYLAHAWHNTHSPMRWRLAMWTDLLMVSFAVLADGRIMSPTYLAYIMVILGNGMRYGLRFFAEAIVATFALVCLILLLRFPQYISSVTVSTGIFLAFFGIIILYSYSLMSRIEKARWKLEKESNLDHLTGLLNRRGLYEKSSRLFRGLDQDRHSVTVLFADLDGFKSINDTLGHPAGDKVLKEVARMAGAAMRSTDIAARFGGDEFVMVLPDCSLDDAMQVARRLQQAVAEWAAQAGITLSISIGLGRAPQHGTDLDSVLERVDSAMYRGKLSFGKGSIQLADDVCAT
jgi:diguanylate cyclase (GGDEF)-like protein